MWSRESIAGYKKAGAKSRPPYLVETGSLSTGPTFCTFRDRGEIEPAILHDRQLLFGE